MMPVQLVKLLKDINQQISMEQEPIILLSPYGLQKRVELGRALAMDPELLLLDEPMAGMNIEEKQDMCRFIIDINEQYGTTIVLIEHDMGVVVNSKWVGTCVESCNV